MKVVVFLVGLALLVLPSMGKEVGKKREDQHVAIPRQCVSTGPTCEISCDDLPDNSINQYCGNCTSFFVCMEGDRVFGHCPEGTEWDDSDKACMDQSTTCTECYFPPKCEATGPGCIRHCQEQDDGDYQLCANCTSYATCSDGIMSTTECPDGMFWDDDEPKGCATESDTCYECYEYYLCNYTGPSCISDCDGLDDGNYQACGNCMMYFTCTGGVRDYSLCPLRKYWDDDLQGCFAESSTCTHCGEDHECETTGESCKLRCYGEEDGHYQACSTCHSYMSCNNGQSSYTDCTPPDWVWDDISKACMPYSNTCSCYNSRFWSLFDKE